MKPILLTLSALASFQLQAFVTVGDKPNDPQCTYENIQDAIDNSGETEIRVARNKTYNENLVLDDIDIDIRGGYANCDAANQGDRDLVNDPYSLVAAANQQEAVISISGDQEQSTVNLSGLSVVGGTAGISSSESVVDLSITHVQSGSNEKAGIFIAYGQQNVDINTTALALNGSELSSYGGLGCFGQNTIINVSGKSRIFDNTATSGGGIYAVAQCQVNVFSPVVIEDNTAVEYGGGIYAGVGANVNLHGVTIRDNLAQVYGGAFWAEGEGTYVLLTQSHVLNNEGDFAAGLAFNGATVDVENSRVANNSGPNRALFGVEEDSSMSFKYVTMANNAVTRSLRNFQGGLIEVKSSIIYDDQPVYAGSFSSFNITCALVNEVDSFTADDTVQVGNPLFVDANNGDYHLQPISPAIDFCASAANVNVNYPGDIDGQARGYDQPDVDNGGVYDLGADEYREGAYDLIFADNFEVGN